MPIEKQVVSLEIAQRLKALGAGQDSYFVWYVGLLYKSSEVGWGDGKTTAAAYTVAELIELLGQNLSALSPSPSGGYVAMAWPWDNMSAEAETPANALGLLLEKTLDA